MDIKWNAKKNFGPDLNTIKYNILYPILLTDNQSLADSKPLDVTSLPDNETLSSRSPGGTS